MPKQLANSKRVKTSNKCDAFTQLVGSVCKLEVVKEHKFDPDRNWRIDYAIPAQMIAIEVEGGVWTNGRHTRGSGFLKDMEKYNELACKGWALLRVTPDTLLTTKTLEMIQRCAKMHLFLQKKIP